MRLTLLAAASALAVLSGCASVQPPSPALTHTHAPAKNIIFFLGDGMGINTLTAARIYAVGEEGELTLDTLPESAFVKTFSNDAQVTDSAASMSAYMTGVKVNNNVLSMSADTPASAPALDAFGNRLAGRCTTGRPVATLAELAKQRGMSVGVVTTTRVTDATPGAVFSHVCHRAMENDIAAALVPGGAGYNAALGARGLDVLLGGGSAHFTPTAKGGKRSDGRDLLAELAAQGVRSVADSAQLRAVDTSASAPLVGLFAPYDLAFDSMRDAARQPSLPEMAVKAIGILANNPKGFFLVVEGGMIDLALHNSNARRALQETVVFDNTLKAAIAQMRAIDPDLKNTLIVATADHDHSLLLNGYARRTGKTTPTEAGVLGLMRRVDNNEIKLDADGAPFTIIGFGAGENRVQGSRGAAPHLTSAQVSADDYRQEAVVRTEPGYETHSGTDVYLGAVGAGAARFGGTIDNTRVFELIKAAAGW
ncbi:alkaline phosphatase [Massilia violaceinigra]|uniref:Alkaline phosphatase n=1 Tax=Massilia violaceinigra TaxID=2045208 RepID=A0ABY4AFK7_9BURK|nr:alkaline phosphatase [Massilia violaceinigra]UOD31358.1 alkaline phosphatase [Massilia violaceinigra]